MPTSREPQPAQVAYPEGAIPPQVDYSEEGDAPAGASSAVEEEVTNAPMSPDGASAYPRGHVGEAPPAATPPAPGAPPQAPGEGTETPVQMEGDDDDEDDEEDDDEAFNKLNAMTVTDLRALAKHAGLTGYSSLDKAELVDLLYESGVEPA